MFRTFIRNLSQSSIRYSDRLTVKVKCPMQVFGPEGRYVQALYSAASQKNELEAVETSLRKLQKELTKPKILDFLATSMISRTGKAKLLKNLAEAAGMPSTASNFLILIAENGRLTALNKIILMFLEAMVWHRKESECEVITAEPLTAEQKEKVIKILKLYIKTDKKVYLKETIDESILGGMVVGIEDKIIDLCIARKIMTYTRILNQSL